MDAKVTAAKTCGECSRYTVGALTGFTTCAEVGKFVRSDAAPLIWCPILWSDRT